MFTYFTIIDKLSKSQFYSNRSEPIPESIASKPVDIILAADCVCLFSYPISPTSESLLMLALIGLLRACISVTRENTVSLLQHAKNIFFYISNLLNPPEST